jgi:hypothetical protein
MNEALKSAAQKLRDRADELNTLTDEAARLVAEIEDFLGRTCSAGVTAYVPVRAVGITDGEGKYTGIDWFQSLGYERVGKRFRICVVTGDDFDPESCQTTAWAECDRATKLDTLAKLPDLIHAVAESLQRRVDDARNAIGSAKDVVRAFGMEA